MSTETELQRLERRVQKDKTSVHESEMKVEELVASVHEAEKFKVKSRRPGKSAFPATSRSNSQTPKSD
jgi:hypothetical protein